MTVVEAEASEAQAEVVDPAYKAKLQSIGFGAASWNRERQLRSAFYDIVQKRKKEHQ